MKIIGLTGPSGTGKGFVSELLASRGIPSIDTDAVYHDILEPPSDCLDELVSAFGDAVLKNGRLDRPALAAIVFSDKAGLSLLNLITHKYILAKTDELLSMYRQNGCVAVAVDAPALFEAGYDGKCDFTIAVTAPKEIRIERIMKRDTLTRHAAEQRINGQQPEDFYTSRATYTINNASDSITLMLALDKILASEGILA